ncbi:MAG: hypothetical protein GY772_17460 [bacterium]|nr:hypothetical protein [bacterium]
MGPSPSDEVAAAVLEPHFFVVRDMFLDFEAEDGGNLRRLRRTRMVVDPSVRDSPRHFAACRDDGMLVLLAPAAADLPVENLMAILAHELGHAADFAYPGNWVTLGPGNEAVWIGERDDRVARKWRRLWEQRTDDQVEWAADAIAEAVTGVKVEYCGDCMLQCFSGGNQRPPGLR